MEKKFNFGKKKKKVIDLKINSKLKIANVNFNFFVSLLLYFNLVVFSANFIRKQCKVISDSRQWAKNWRNNIFSFCFPILTILQQFFPY